MKILNNIDNLYMPTNLQMGFKNVRRNMYTGTIQTRTKLPIVGEKQPLRPNIANIGKILPIKSGGGGCGCGK